MTRILHVDSSLFSGEGVSSTLAARFVESLRDLDPAVEVRHRDLARDPVPHLDAERLAAISTPPGQRDPAQQRIAAEADALIEELRQADLLVLGAPMYNFSVSSPLKAWFDHVARAGATFKYTETGPVGLLENTRAVVFTSRGGIHRDQSSDSQTPLLRTFLGLLGIDEVEFVYAEGLNLGQAPRAQAVGAALAETERLARSTARAA